MHQKTTFISAKAVMGVYSTPSVSLRVFLSVGNKHTAIARVTKLSMRMKDPSSLPISWARDRKVDFEETEPRFQTMMKNTVMAVGTVTMNRFFPLSVIEKDDVYLRPESILPLMREMVCCIVELARTRVQLLEEVPHYIRKWLKLKKFDTLANLHWERGKYSSLK